MALHQRFLEGAVKMWEEEDRPYWRHIRGSIIDDCLRNDFGVEPRNPSAK